MADDEKLVLDMKPGELAYFHPDFHAAIARAVRHLDNHYGPDATERFLRRVARTVFADLADDLRRDGLDAFERHWRALFDLEGGDYTLTRDADALTLEVRRCPAVAYLQQAGQWSTPRFCETTRVVNDELGKMAGLRCTCDYEPDAGRCVQRFTTGGEGEAKP